MEKIILTNAASKDDFYEISKLMGKFNLDRSRLICSEISFLIKNNNENIGFILLVKEKLENTLFLDMFIIKENQNKGFGKEALKLLSQLTIDKNIIAETKISNVKSISAMDNIGELVLQLNDKNYYYLPSSKANDFVNSIDYQRLYDYESETKIVKTLKIENYY